jgi:hypothetical protein
MAAKTPSTIKRESNGSNNLLICTFTDIDDTDTWTSGMNSVIGAWVNATDGVTGGIDVAESAGVFTFSTASANRTAQVYVIVKD